MSSLELRRILHEGAVGDLDRLKHLRGHSSLKAAEKKALSELFFRRANELKEENAQGAVSLLKNAVILNPQFQEALFLLMSLVENPDDAQFLYDFLQRKIENKTFTGPQHLLLGKFYSLYADQTQNLECFYQSIYHLQACEGLQNTLLTEEIETLWGRTLLNLGILSQEPEDMLHAIRYFQKIEKKSGPSAQIYRFITRAYYQLCLVFNDQSYFQLCLENCEQALKLDPSNEDTLFFFAHLNSVLYAMEGDEKYLSSACRAYKQQMDKAKDNKFSLLHDWGRLLILSGIYKRELADFEEALTLFAQIPSTFANYAEVLFSEAEAHLEAYELEEQQDDVGHLERLHCALQKSRKSVELCGKNARGWCLLGLSTAKLGAYFDNPASILEAVEHLQTSLNLDSKIPKTWYALATAHHFLSDSHGYTNFLKKAAKEYSYAHELSPHFLPQFYYEWGLVLKKLGEEGGKKKYIASAAQKMHEAIVLFQNKHPLLTVKADWISQYCSILNFLGAISGSIECHEQALDTVTQALKLNADSAILRYSYALSLISLGEATAELDFYQLAMHQLCYLVSKDPQDEVAWNEWGLTLMRAGELIDDPTIENQKWQFLKDAELKLINAVKLGHEASCYHLMALYSLMNRLEASMYYLKRAYDAGVLPPNHDLLSDIWLDNLTKSEEFHKFYKEFLY